MAFTQLRGLLPVLLVACGGSPPMGSVSVHVDTLTGGVQLVTNTPRGDEPRVPWSLDVASAVVIGMEDGPEETRFGRLGAVAVGPNGRIYIPDGQALTIRVFDGSGTYFQSIGRGGEGPGEFRSLDGVAINGSEILSRDPLLNRITRFNLEGLHVDSFLMERPFAQFSGQSSFWVDSMGVVHDFTQIGTTMSVDSLGIVSYGRDGRVDTVITSVSAPRRLLLRDSSGEPKAAAQVPFSAFGRASVSKSGLVFAGSGAEYEITVYEEGKVVRKIRKVEVTQPVPGWASDTIEVVIQRLRESAPTGSVDRGDLPKSQPFFNGLIVDELGFLWVPREGMTRKPVSRYDIFDRSGVFLGFFETPEMVVDQVGSGFVAGRIRDELGVERVIVLGLSRSAGTPQDH